jgi:Cu(I)-responsive transcriptional regulator
VADENVENLKIGDLAKATAARVETIRWYERVGLLPAPARTPGNYRAYGPRHLERLSFIRRARELGFSIPQVRELLGLADDRGRPCAAVDAIARQHLAAVERKIADLEALRRELGGLIGQCRRGTVAECRILQALSPAGAGQEDFPDDRPSRSKDRRLSPGAP